jgi:hypothetical protein
MSWTAMSRVVLLATVALSLQSAQASAPRARDCPSIRGGIYNVRVRDMSCSSALRLIGHVDYPARTLTAHLNGWSCKTTSTYPEGATFRCERHKKVFWWTAGG